jgi:hypothetical protein
VTLPADLPVFAFSGDRLIVRGPAAEVLPAIKAAGDTGEAVLTFDAATGKVIDLDLRGSDAHAQARRTPPPRPQKRGPRRPRRGVVAREVTLLPRHWDWLSTQPGGASVALRKLVEAALRDGEGPDRARQAKDATYRFITTMAGDRSGYEEAVRMLFAGDCTAFEAAVAGWPGDVAETALALAERAWRNGQGS